MFTIPSIYVILYLQLEKVNTNLTQVQTLTIIIIIIIIDNFYTGYSFQLYIHLIKTALPTSPV